MASDIIKFISIVDEALQMTDVRLAASPDYGVYLHAKEQLQWIRSNFNSANNHSVGALNIDIGLMAVKELDATDPEYSDKLCLVSYLYKKNKY